MPRAYGKDSSSCALGYFYMPVDLLREQTNGGAECVDK